MLLRHAALVEMAKSWRSCLSRSATNDDFHDASFVKDGAGITYMTGPPNSHEELRGFLERHCQIKHYQLRTRSWTGIGRVAGTLSAFQCTAFENQPWRRRKDLDRLLDELGFSKSQSVHDAKKARRGLR
jgi:hypothetical protein